MIKKILLKKLSNGAPESSRGRGISFWLCMWSPKHHYEWPLNTKLSKHGPKVKKLLHFSSAYVFPAVLQQWPVCIRQSVNICWLIRQSQEWTKNIYIKTLYLCLTVEIQPSPLFAHLGQTYASIVYKSTTTVAGWFPKKELMSTLSLARQVLNGYLKYKVESDIQM